MSLRELVPFIDWTPFFHTWELRGRYPGILEDPRSVQKPKNCWRMPALLAEIIRDDLLTARGVYGFSRPTASATISSSIVRPRSAVSA